MAYIFSFTLTLLSFTYSPDCSSVKEGKFKITIDAQDSTIVTLIERKGDIQIEKCEQLGIEYKLKVVWIDNCTYQLSLLETIRDDYNLDYPENQIITVEINEVYDEYYFQTSTSNMVDFVDKSKVEILQ